MAERFYVGNPGLPRVVPNICGRRACPGGWTIHRNPLSGCLIHYVFSGMGTFEKNGKTYRVHTGDLFICLPEEPAVYTADPEDPYDYGWLNFEPAPELLVYLQEDVIHLPAAGRIFTQMVAAKDKNERSWIVCGLLYQLLGLLGEKYQSRHKSRDYLEDVIAYMDANYHLQLQVAALAEQAGLERSYFCRLFRRQTGFSPQEYLISRRLDGAAQLLQQTSLTQKEIARRVGYGDVYTFSRMFRRRYGQPPGQYRLNANGQRMADKG